MSLDAHLEFDQELSYESVYDEVSLVMSLAGIACLAVGVHVDRLPEQVQNNMRLCDVGYLAIQTNKQRLSVLQLEWQEHRQKVAFMESIDPGKNRFQRVYRYLTHLNSDFTTVNDPNVAPEPEQPITWQDWQNFFKETGQSVMGVFRRTKK